MPLHGERLIDSDLFFESTGDEFKAAVALWWASWKQVPAASLPDNPRVLAGLARVSDAKRWAKIGERALHGWIRCSDGRLYHPVVAELANEAWADRQDHRAGRDAERERKQAEREDRKRMFADLKEAGVHLAWNVQMAELRAAHIKNCPQPVRQLSGGQVEDRPEPVAAIEGTVEGTGTKEGEANASLSPEATKPKAYPDLFEAAWKAYPHVKGRSSKPDTLDRWKRLPAETRQGLPTAAATYARDGREPKMDCGAPAMDRWLKGGKFADWIAADAGPMGVDWPDTRWAVAVDLWRTEGKWEPRLGPEPGAPGCRVPAHLLIQPTAHGSAA